MLYSMKHVVCLMTGSLESSVAAYLLRQKGYSVTGAYVYNALLNKKENEALVEQTKMNCDKLGINLRVVKIENDEWDKYKRSLVRKYEDGHQPDLLISYNKHINLGAAMNYVMRYIGADAIATGHYARLSDGVELSNRRHIEGVELWRGLDQVRDESALLSEVPQKSLQKLLLPLGDFTQEVVNMIGRDLNIVENAMTKQSLENARLELKMKQCITKDVKAKKGRLIDFDTGRTLMTHQGLHHYCLGDRIRIDSCDKNYYVVTKDAETNEVALTSDSDHPALYSETLFLSLAHWLHQVPYEFYKTTTMDCTFRKNWSCPLTLGTLTVGSGNNYCGNSHIILSSLQPFRVINKGQTVTIYNKEVCMGSARIQRPGPSLYDMNYEQYTNDKPKAPPGGSLIKDIFFKYIGLNST